MNTSDTEYSITAVAQQHPDLGEFWEVHCSCGNVSTLYRTREDAERATCDHRYSSQSGDPTAAVLNAIIASAAQSPTAGSASTRTDANHMLQVLNGYSDFQAVYGDAAAQELQKMADYTTWTRSRWLDAWTSSRAYTLARQQGGYGDPVKWLAGVRHAAEFVSVSNAVRALNLTETGYRDF